jgi:opacity protein-like surface antigen
MKLALLCALFLLSVSAVTPAQSAADWSGFYAGGSVSGSSGQTKATATLLVNQISNLTVIGRGLVVVPGTTLPLAASRHKSTWSGGVNAGYNWQHGKFVIGPEVSVEPFHQTFRVSQSAQLTSTALTPVTTISAERAVRLTTAFSFRMRAGATWKNNLIYGLGGYSFARARVSSIDSFTNPGGLAAQGVCGAQNTPCQFNSGAEGPVITTASQNSNLSGFAVGGGFERKLNKQWSVGFEYSHTMYGSKTYALSSQTTKNTGPETLGEPLFVDGFGIHGLLGNVSTGPTKISLRVDTFGGRVNFHF